MTTSLATAQLHRMAVSLPCHTIAWLDRDGELIAYWCGVSNGHDGRGWTDERREAEEYVLREDADGALKVALASFGDGRVRCVEVQEES